MSNNERETPAAGQDSPSSAKKLIVAALCAGIILAGAAAAVILVQTAPKAQKRPPEKMAPLVTIRKVYPETRPVVVQAMGSVVPDQELTLKSRVAGEIVAMHPEFTEGGIVHQGDLILQIDDLDYKLIVAQKESAVTDARYALKLELGRQDVARREWELLNKDMSLPASDADLALRRPHLEKARSDIKAAEAELEAARLQLARTRIFAPFNAIVRSTLVEKGSHVAAQETLATLAGTDRYWIQASIPVDRLQWIDIPDSRRSAGSSVRITYNGGAQRQGRVLKLLSDLATEGRMARVMIAVDDPMSLKTTANKPIMLIGEYVRVEINGHEIENAFRLPRSALRDDAHIWVVGPEGNLEIREVQTIWRDARTVLLSDGLEPGERVIVSDLAAPVPGMDVIVENESQDTIQPALTRDSGPENS